MSTGSPAVHGASPVGGTATGRASEGPVDHLLRTLARRAAQVAGVKTCSVYLLDPREGTFRGRAVHNPIRPDALDWLRHSEAGIRADGFTRQIVETRAPVVITDAQRDPRPVRTAMRRWGIHAMLGVPMVLDDEVIGLVFLDNRDEPHTYSLHEQLSVLALANIGAIALREAQQAEESRSALRRVANGAQALRETAAIQDELIDRLATGEGLAGVARAVAGMTGKPCAILDDELVQLAVGMAPGGSAAWSMGSFGMRSGAVARVATALRHGDHEVIDAAPGAGIYRRLMIARSSHESRGSFVVLAEHGSRLSSFDALVAEKAAALTALHTRTTGGPAPRAALRGADAVALTLLGDRRANPETAGQLARSHGLQLERPHMVLVVEGDGEPTAVTPADVEAAVIRVGVTGPPLCARHGEGVAVVAPLPAGEPPEAAARRLARGVLDELPQGRMAQAAVTVARDAQGCAAGVADCIRLLRAAGATGQVVGREDLTAAQLFIACAEPEAVARYARDLLGALMAGGPEDDKLLTTLRVFIREGRHVRRVAAVLDVHENTVRYRLGRIKQVTGLDVAADADDQLAAHIALMALGGGEARSSGDGSYRPVRALAAV